MFCSYGTLDSITEFGQTLISSNSTCADDGSNIKYAPSSCDINTKGLGYSSEKAIDNAFNTKCKGLKNCTFPLTSSLIPNNCTDQNGRTYLANET